MKLSLVLPGILVLFLSGCSSNFAALDGAQYPQKTLVTSSDSKVEGKLKNKFMAQYAQWKGVKYRLGGMDKSGVDCSGFVHVAFLDQLRKNIPRTTEQQVQLGKHIGQSNLKVGDLVFFKTSAKVRHVGIYIGSGQFMHASTSKGVTISYLDNVYWSSRYWTARRII